MKIAIHVCPLFLMAATICATPAAARGYLDCLTKKVIIVDSPKGSNLSSTEDKLGFWIDEAAKTIMFADGTPLIVHRFDDHWISADRGDMAYEFDRQNGNLMYGGRVRHSRRGLAASRNGGLNQNGSSPGSTEARGRFYRSSRAPRTSNWKD